MEVLPWRLNLPPPSRPSARAGAGSGLDGPDPDGAHLPDDWLALAAAEDEAIVARRRQVLGEAADSNPAELVLPRVGLALSGGGVRSADIDASADCMVAYRRIQSSLCALVLKPPTENTAFNYWHPGASPAEQARDSRQVLQALASRFPMFGTGYLQRPRDATAAADAAALDAAVPASAQSSAAVAAARIVTRPARAVASPATTAAASSAASTAVLTPAPASVPASPASPAAPHPGGSIAAMPSLRNCVREAGNTTLYMQIYDESSRLPATALRQALQPQDGSPLLVAPIENVVRSADLRQQRRPVPWPQPTLVLHDPASRDCARHRALHWRALVDAG